MHRRMSATTTTTTTAPPTLSLSTETATRTIRGTSTASQTSNTPSPDQATSNNPKLLAKLREQITRPRSRSHSPLPSAKSTMDPYPGRGRVTHRSFTEPRPTTPAAPKARAPQKPTPCSGGTFTDCGRHSNEWLFNNFSVTGAAKSLLRRKDS